MAAETLRQDSRTQRFARRRAEILDVASAQINVSGVRGMTLTAVARALDLDTSSVTYYFRKKDDLAAACMERSLSLLHGGARLAGGEANPRARVRRLVRDSMALQRRLRDRDTPPLAVLSDLSALEDGVGAPLKARYGEMFEIVRGFFDPGQDREARTRSVISASALIADIHWLPAWTGHYLARDLDRTGERLIAVLERGLGVGAPWPVRVDALESPADAAVPQTRFLHAATNLINRHGYRGASVEGIARELGVSTGSFYHHLDHKDDLVAACFERSFEVWDAAQTRAAEAPGSVGDRLATMFGLLIAHQFAAESPLLRVSAYQALPPELRQVMLDRSGRITLHVAGLIADGMAQGSVAAVDPLIASQAVIATIHAASDLRDWAARRPLAEAVAAYLRVLETGLF